MRHRNRHLFKHNQSIYSTGPGLFPVVSIIPQIIIIEIVIAAYWFILKKDWFPLWINYIYWGVKAIIALEIIVAAGRSLVLSIVAMILGGIAIYLIQTQGFSLITSNDAWQLAIMGAVGFVITFIVRSIRRKG